MLARSSFVALLAGESRLVKGKFANLSAQINAAEDLADQLRHTIFAAKLPTTEVWDTAFNGINDRRTKVSEKIETTIFDLMLLLENKSPKDEIPPKLLDDYKNEEVELRQVTLEGLKLEAKVNAERKNIFDLAEEAKKNAEDTLKLITGVSIFFCLAGVTLGVISHTLVGEDSGSAE
jgi:hypothetical protein